MEGMYLTDFADERKVKADTVAAYIRSNSEQFEGLTWMEGKKKVLSEQAIELLDKKYPTPVMVQIVQDPELVKSYMAKSAEVDKLKEKYEVLFKELGETTNKLITTEAQLRRLDENTEMKARQMAEIKVAVAVEEALEVANREKELELQLKDKDIDAVKEAMERLKADHEAEMKKKDEDYKREMEAKNAEIERNKSRGFLDRLKNKWL